MQVNIYTWKTSQPVGYWECLVWWVFCLSFAGTAEPLPHHFPPAAHPKLQQSFSHTCLLLKFHSLTPLAAISFNLAPKGHGATSSPWGGDSVWQDRPQDTPLTTSCVLPSSCLCLQSCHLPLNPSICHQWPSHFHWSSWAHQPVSLNLHSDFSSNRKNPSG